MSDTTITVETTLIAAFDAHVLLDAKLSMKAKAIAAILLASGSWAKEEDVTTEDLIALSTDGRDSILAGLRELEQAGYLTRTRRTGEGGRIYWQRTMRARPKERRPSAAGKPSTALPYTEDPNSLELNSSEPGPEVPSTALPSTENPPSLELNSSELADRTITGKPVHGAGGSTTGESAPTIGGKSGYGAEGLPIRTYAGTGTHASARADLGSNNSSLIEEEYLDQDQPMDLDPQSSLLSSSKDVDLGSAREGEGSGEGEAGSLELNSSATNVDPVLAKMCFQMLTTCGVRATAGRLYPRYAFEHIRAEVVRYLEQYTTDFQREKNAGVLVYRIKNSAYVPLTEADRMGSTYLQWRTEAERTAEQRALMAPRSLELSSSDFAMEPDSSQPAPDWHVEHLGRGAALRSSMLRVDRNAPPADPVWVDVMRELALSGLEHLNGSSGMRLDDGSWLIYVAEPRHLQWLEHRGVKQVVRTLGPMTGTPIAGLKVAFTADRAAYLEAIGGH